jgi:hypothetical protein
MSEADEQQKKVIKEAFKEWLSEMFQKGTSTLGLWALRAIAAAIFGALVYFVLMVSGWHR